MPHERSLHIIDNWIILKKQTIYVGIFSDRFPIIKLNDMLNNMVCWKKENVIMQSYHCLIISSSLMFQILKLKSKLNIRHEKLIYIYFKDDLNMNILKTK
jgi:hypothetical protein